MDARNYLGNNLTIEMVKNTKIKKLVILTAGTEKIMRDGAKKLNFIVEINKEKKNYLPNITTMKNLIEAFGYETDKWIGKVINLSISTMMGKEVIIGKGNEDEDNEPKAGAFGEDIPVPNICASCDAKITNAEKAYSIKAFHKTLCMKCQKLQK